MLAIRPSLLLAGLVALSAATSSSSAWHETRVTTSPTPSLNPDVTFDAGDGLHVLWEEAGEVRHLLHDRTEWGPIEVVGLGSRFDRYTCLV